MKIRHSVFVAGVLAGVFSTAVNAMPSSADMDKATSSYPMDCTKAKDKTRCAALNQKIAACKNKTDDAWLTCMYGAAQVASFTPPTPRDCSKARNRNLCEAFSDALQACRDKRTRDEHRSCVADRLWSASLTNE